MTGPVPSPCRDICRLGADQVCDGCGRTIMEIAGWRALAGEERIRIMTRTANWVVRPATNSTEPHR